MVTETELHYRQPCYDSVRMAQQQRQYSPTPETVSSAADAMLKLSGTGHHAGGEYFYHSPKQGDRGANMYTAHVEYRAQGSVAPTSSSPTSPLVSTTVPSPRSRSSSLTRLQRKEREFVPDYRKDNQYWLKRQKNNEAAKRSREKRRMNDMVMSDRLNQVIEEKHKLQMELEAIKRHFGLALDKTFHAGDVSHSVSPASSPGKTPGTDTTRSSPLYDSHNGSPSIKPAPPLIPLQGRLAEVIAQRMMSKPPPLEPVPDSPPVSTVSPVYHQHRQQQQVYANGTHHQHQHYTMSQQYPMGTGKPASPLQSCSEQQLQYSMMSYSSGQSPRSPSYSSTQSPQSPHTMQSVCSPDPSLASYRDHHTTQAELSTPSSQDHGAPLNLSKRRRLDLDDDEAMAVRAEERKGIPHKLRYKNYSSEIREAEQDETEAGSNMQWHLPENNAVNSQLSVANVFQHTSMQQHMCQDPTASSDEPVGPYRQAREARYSTSSSVHQDMSMDGSDNSQPLDPLTQESSAKSDDNASEQADPGYLERRERNNVAARKCRENRRLVNELRLVKSQVLESENVKLKDELRNLSEEVHGLKKLIEQKHQAQEAGEPFEPPVDFSPKAEENE